MHMSWVKLFRIQIKGKFSRALSSAHTEVNRSLTLKSPFQMPLLSLQERNLSSDIMVVSMLSLSRDRGEDTGHFMMMIYCKC